MSGEVWEEATARTARGAAQVSISSRRQLVGGDKWPSIKSPKAGGPSAVGEGRGGGGDGEGGQAGAPANRSPLLPSISKPSDTVIYGGVIFYRCRYWRSASTSCR